mmetsp:Transcript_123804/g.214641  ORF Transcript_123804/g.214641 Transcript_123804/m.214641 type:complete len:105 (+) Transcript_123804:667-981(+)
MGDARGELAARDDSPQMDLGETHALGDTHLDGARERSYKPSGDLGGRSSKADDLGVGHLGVLKPVPTLFIVEGAYVLESSGTLSATLSSPSTCFQELVRESVPA